MHDRVVTIHAEVRPIQDSESSEHHLVNIKRYPSANDSRQILMFRNLRIGELFLRLILSLVLQI